jgi:nitroimidazol reductase NimA-like FMN-containing flavoprotein (pyridoxamine 5'-phosphate oxidase superfamily)
MSSARFPSTRITRLRAKERTDRALLDELLDTVHLGHIGVDVDGWPVVMPSVVVRDGERILTHGSTGSPWLRRVAAGAPVTLTVTAWDGVVVARSAFESSIHYRSAMLFGSFHEIPAQQRDAALDVITEALIPGRVAEVRRPRAAELAATTVLAMPIERWSLKVSAGWPDDPDDDVAGPAWAGVLPLHSHYGDPVPTHDLRAGIEVPPSVLGLTSLRSQCDR